MVTRVLELIPMTGNSAALGRMIEDTVRPLLMTVPGFVQQATLVSEGESSLVVLLSIWKSHRSVEQYDRELLPLIYDMTQSLREGFSQEKAFHATNT